MTTPNELDPEDDDDCGDITIRMYYLDREPPHIHGLCDGCESAIAIDGSQDLLEVEHPGVEVAALPDFVLRVTFLDGTVKTYDTKPLFGLIKGLEKVFDQAHLSPAGHAVIWDDDTDIAIEEIWENGILEKGEWDAARRAHQKISRD